MCRLLALASVLALPVWAAAAGEKAQPETIELGGLRQTLAVLTVSEDEYTVKVRMLPVRCFDEPTNASLNHEKAREMALLALAQHLAGKKNVRLRATGVQVEKTDPEGKFYTLVLRVARKNVTVEAVDTEPAKVPAGNVERVTLTGGLFTRKQDYLDTMKRLLTAIQADVVQAAAKAREDDFLTAVSDLEETGLKRLDQLGQEIKNDLLLLGIEQEELNGLLVKQKEQTLDLLKEAVKKHEKKEKP